MILGKILGSLFNLSEPDARGDTQICCCRDCCVVCDYHGFPWRYTIEMAGFGGDFAPLNDSNNTPSGDPWIVESPGNSNYDNAGACSWWYEDDDISIEHAWLITVDSDADGRVWYMELRVKSALGAFDDAIVLYEHECLNDMEDCTTDLEWTFVSKTGTGGVPATLLSIHDPNTVLPSCAGCGQNTVDGGPGRKLRWEMFGHPCADSTIPIEMPNTITSKSCPTLASYQLNVPPYPVMVDGTTISGSYWSCVLISSVSAGCLNNTPDNQFWKDFGVSSQQGLGLPYLRCDTSPDPFTDWFEILSPDFGDPYFSDHFPDFPPPTAQNDPDEPLNLFWANMPYLLQVFKGEEICCCGDFGLTPGFYQVLIDVELSE